MQDKDKSNELRNLPIVSIVIVDEFEEDTEGKSEPRLFYAVAKHRGFVSVDDPREVYHESKVNGTFEEILANCLVTEH